MTDQQVQSLQSGVEIVIPLSKLKRSPKNARRTPHAASDVAALAGSIAAKGLIQPPVVTAERDAEGTQTGRYLVNVGEGRRLALRLLAKQKRIRRDEPVRCLLDEANDAFEVSLDENVTRFAMHPADQFEAFRALSEERGRSVEEIAGRFGVSATLVRQRLRLGAASPLLIAAYRAGELTLDQMMAFAASEDRARQEQVFRDLSYNRSPSLIRRLMTEHEVEASDRRARYVGVEAYEAAGGVVRQDLFSERGDGWFEDPALLDRLVVEKLTAEVEAVRAAEGWKWGEPRLDYVSGPGLGRVYPRAPEADAQTRASLQALADEYDGIIAACADDGPTEPEATRLAEIDAALRAASEPVYAPDDIARAGVFAILDHGGAVRFERGFIRPEDETPKPREAGDDGDKNTRQASGPKPLSDRLIADLSAHRTMALRDRLGGQPQTALIAATHALVLQFFYDNRWGSCLDLTAAQAHLGGWAEGVDDSLAGRSVEARHAAWAARLPKAEEDLLPALEGFAPKDRLALFAHCVSLTVDAVVVRGRSADALAHSDELARLVGMDMTKYWTATTATYLGRVAKADILAAVSEAVSPENAAKLAGLKKDAMAEAATSLLAATGWLPPLLRRPGVGPS